MTDVATEEATAAEGTELFPIPESPLGEACKKFVNNTKDIAELKAKKPDIEKKVLEEMKKEGRESLTVTVGNDNWTFDVKKEAEKLRCIKVTRQPQPKTVVIDEE